MDLKNITTFENFKKLFEEAIPNEFSNTTGFRESLVGRAVFGILRYFKKGIDLGKLEFYKRKLENEYFAAILRFCAYKKIDLKTGIEPTSNVSDDDEHHDDNVDSENINPYNDDYCGVLKIDYSFDGYANKLSSISTQFSNYIKSLNPILNDKNTSDEDKQEANKLIDHANKMIKCVNSKFEINKVFYKLVTSTGSTSEELTSLLDMAKNFLSGDVAKYCNTYKGTDNEKNIIKKYTTSTDDVVKNKANEILPLLEKKYLINEKITSGINKSIGITQMLGDQLNLDSKASSKVNVYEYLKKIGINNVDEINFVELVKLFKSKPDYQKMVSSNNFLNHDGIKKIQYAVSDGIIYHVKKTPDNVGINPGEGGKVNYEEDTSLKKTWEKKVEFVKSEFSGFFLFNEVDPFVLLNLNEAMRNKNSHGYDRSYDVINNRGIVDNIANSSILQNKANNLGLKARGNEKVSTEYKLYVFSFVYGGKQFYPVLSLRGGDDGDKKVYRYIGNVNFNRIIKNMEYDKPDFKERAKDFSNAIWDSNIKENSDKDFLNFLKLPDSINLENNHYFDSIYFTAIDYSRINSRIDSSNNKKSLRILYNYVDKNQSNGNFKGPRQTATSNDFKIKFLSKNNIIDINNINNIKAETDKNLITLYSGEIYEINQEWENVYFPDQGDNQVSKYIRISYINKDIPYAKKIIL